METETPFQLKPAKQDHKSFVANLSQEQRRNLTQTSDREGWKALFIHFIALISTGLWIAWALPAWPLVLVIHGILLVFLFTAMHEATHRTVFKTKRLNDLLATFCGVLLFLPPFWFRHFHFAHHRFTQDRDRDPELESPKPETRWQYIWWVSGLPIWRSQAVTLFKSAFGHVDYGYIPNSLRAKVRFEARVMIVAYAILFVLSTIMALADYHVAELFLWLWLLPLVLGQPFLRLYLLAEHGRCPLVANMLENTRTTFTNKLVRRLAWNMPFHAEHHTMPTVPFFKLPDLHLLLRNDLQTTSNGYSKFNRAVWSSFTHERQEPKEG